MRAMFPSARVSCRVADFTRPLDLSDCDGLLMANSLHFVDRGRQPEVLARVVGHLRPGGRFILVEYDADHGSPWVPHPISSRRWEQLAEAAGLRRTRLLARVPSRFLGAIYSAIGFSPGDAVPSADTAPATHRSLGLALEE